MRDLEYLTQNLGLGYLAACLLKEGHEVRTLDALAEGRDRKIIVEENGKRFCRFGLPYGEIVERIDPNVDMIGITAPFSNHAKIIKELVAAIHGRFPDKPIVVGGICPSAQPERVIESGVDFAVVGEGETPIIALASGMNPENIPGVWFRKNNKIINGGRAEMIADLDSIPFPERNLFPMQTYLSFSPRGIANEKTATIITSRGCPFDCTFCSIHPIYSRKWRARSAANILAEIDELIEKWGVNCIEFEDDNLTLNKERAIDIFSGLETRSIKWLCPNGLRVDSLDAELIELMKRSGCIAVHLAIESGDPDMLKAMNKKLDLQKVREIVGICRDLKMPIVPFFIFGHPGETKKRFLNTIRYLKQMQSYGMVNCGIHIATPYPGTKLLELCKQNGYLIHSDAESRVMFPGDVHIKTPDFSEEDIRYRFYFVLDALGIFKNYSKGLKGFFQFKIRPRFSMLGVDSRKFVADMANEKLEDFDPPRNWLNRIPMRHARDEASIRVNPPRNAESLSILAFSHRPQSIKIFLDETLLGEIHTNRSWNVYTLPMPVYTGAAEASLRFESEKFHDMIDVESESGFNIAWLEFKVEEESLFDTSAKYKRIFISDLPDWKLKDFYATERYFDLPVKWSGQSPEIIVGVPKRAGSVAIFAGSNREHSVDVSIGEVRIGEMKLRAELAEFHFPLPANLPAGRSVLKFQTDAVIPSRCGDQADPRRLGFLLSWFKFQRKIVK